jgi:hypothetical protein
MRRMPGTPMVRGAFVAAFLTIAGFAAMGTALAWSIPVRRL